MKTILGATLAALMLAGPAMAAGPQTGAQVANTISTPFTYGTGDSQAMPSFNYLDSVPVSSSIPGTQASRGGLPDSTMALVNQTGYGQ